MSGTLGNRNHQLWKGGNLFNAVSGYLSKSVISGQWKMCFRTYAG